MASHDAKVTRREVQFFAHSSFSNLDHRRAITGVAGNFGFPITIEQIKLITFDHESVSNRLVVGNHRHRGDSDQWEVIVVLGDMDAEQFEFRYRNEGAEVRERILGGGEVVLVPPGCSLALIPLHAEAMLIEISNKIYNPENYVEDDLFSIDLVGSA